MNKTSRIWKTVPLLLLMIWIVAVTWLSLVPLDSVPLPATLWDKFEHAVAYGVMTILAGWASGQPHLKLRAWNFAALGSVSYGALVEGMQGLADTGRFAQLGDIVANAVGVGLAWGGALLVRKFWLPKRVSPSRSDVHG